MTTKLDVKRERETDSDEDLLRLMTIETGSAFEGAHARVVERSNVILKGLGRGEKLDKLPRAQQALIRVARSYGADQVVAHQIACEEINAIDTGRTASRELVKDGVK